MSFEAFNSDDSEPRSRDSYLAEALNVPFDESLYQAWMRFTYQGHSERNNSDGHDLEEPDLSSFEDFCRNLEELRQHDPFDFLQKVRYWQMGHRAYGVEMKQVMDEALEEIGEWWGRGIDGQDENDDVQ